MDRIREIATGMRDSGDDFGSQVATPRKWLLRKRVNQAFGKAGTDPGTGLRSRALEGETGRATGRMGRRGGRGLPGEAGQISGEGGM
jgi:hypothetical protein